MEDQAMEVEPRVEGDRRCGLVRPIRNHNGKVRFNETPEVVREVDNLDRRMLLVRFDDGATTFLFPHEVTAA